MFSLIITIISIALVAALALATLYYGGRAFNKGSDGATAAKLINEGQQINGAVSIMRADVAAGGTAVTQLSGLATEYLSQVPAGWTAADLNSGTVAKASGVTAGVCVEVEKRAGNSSFADATTAPANATGLSNTRIYGCVKGATEGTYEVHYKL